MDFDPDGKKSKSMAHHKRISQIHPDPTKPSKHQDQDAAGFDPFAAPGGKQKKRKPA